MTQDYNAQLVDQLAADFPKRIESSFAWGNVVSGFQLIPGLTALWPCSAMDEDYRISDMSGQGRVLSGDEANIPTIPAITTYGIMSYLNFVRANSQYVFRPTEKGFDFTGDLAIWTWVRFHAPSTGNRVDYYTKWLETGHDQRSFMLSKTAADVLNFNVSDDGLAPYHTVSAVAADYIVDKWLFVAGRFTPSVELALMIGVAETGAFTWYRNAVGIPAAIFVSTETLRIGAGDGGANFLDGNMGLLGMSNKYLTDIYIQTVFGQSRPLFT